MRRQNKRGDFTLKFDVSCYFNKLCHLHMSNMNLRQRKAYVIYIKALFVGVDNIECLGSGHPFLSSSCEEARNEVLESRGICYVFVTEWTSFPWCKLSEMVAYSGGRRKTYFCNNYKLIFILHTRLFFVHLICSFTDKN